MKPAKRILTLILALVLALGLTLPAASAAFSDVPADAWYAADVEDVQRYGIFKGVGEGRFDPGGTLSLAQAVTLTARSYAMSRQETIPEPAGGTWYDGPVAYAAQRGLCARGEFGTDYDAPCTRRTMALLFARALPEGTERQINTVSALPDVENTAENRGVFFLYEQGVLTGSDQYGTFRPDSRITRSETAAILNRVLDASKRKTFTLTDTPAGGGSTASSGASSLEVWFIDVGQADAALVTCGGQSMLIDGGNAADSNLIYAFLQKHGTDYLDYVVCTHAHEDHVGGLAGALNYAGAGKALCPVTSYDSKAFRNFTDALAKRGLSVTVPAPGDTFSLGSATVQVAGPIRPSDEPNNTSIVLRVVFGETSFLFTGDAEREEEQDILAAGYPLASTVLKVGHHGSDTSTSYPFLREIMPQYAVISVGKGNSYGHPTEAALSRLRDAGAVVYRTDLQGDVHCVSDGKTVTFDVQRNAGIDTLGSAGSSSSSGGQQTQPVPQPAPEPEPQSPTPPAEPVSAQAQAYILNTNTKVFHYPDCASVKRMSEKNKQARTAQRDTLIAEGYKPCGNCNP